MAEIYANWVVALAVVALAVVGSTLVHWKAGRRRHFRITIVLERTYEAPDDPPSSDGV